MLYGAGWRFCRGCRCCMGGIKMLQGWDGDVVGVEIEVLQG